jgi:hypothetical protein
MKRRGIIIAAIVMAIFASPWILGAMWIAGCSIFGIIDEWRYSPTTHFQATDWKNPDKKYRYAVLDHVAAKVIVAGMKEEDVEELLGRPDSLTKNAWQYETKRPGWHFIDFSGGGLLIEFDSSHRVVKISKNLWVD